MSVLTLEKIKALEKLTSDPSITVVVPTNRLMPERQQDPIAVKNAMKEAADKLLSKYNEKEIFYLIKKLDEAGQQIDYAMTLDSLVFFISKEITLIYYLPFKLKQKVTIGNTFDTQQLLSALRKSPSYWVLAISHKPTRLFNVVHDSVDEITETAEKAQKEIGFPFVWHFDVTSDRELLAVGTGDRDSRYLSDIDREFMQDIDKRLDNYLLDNDLPLILLGTVKNISYFKEISKHKNRIIGSKDGDYATAKLEQIAKDSWSVMQQYLKDEQKAAMQLIDEAHSQKKLATGIDDVLGVAQAGQIRILVLEEDAELSANASQNKYNSHEKNLDVTDFLIDTVYQKDGKVIFVPNNSLEEFGKVCAILRYK